MNIALSLVVPVAFLPAAHIGCRWLLRSQRPASSIIAHHEVAEAQDARVDLPIAA